LYSHQIEYLCLNENSISNMNSIENFKNLKNLQLNSNQIEKIENLENLEFLEIFWICENKIQTIENLPKNLKSLWIAANQIERIPENIAKYEEIVDLNLAANLITDISEIFKLKNLPKLKNLYLNDISFGENPLCLINNYRMFLLHHLPLLECLDLIEMTQEEIKEVERTYNKKKIFYTGKIKQMNKLSKSILNSLKVYRNFVTVLKTLQIFLFSKKMKMLEFLKWENHLVNSHSLEIKETETHNINGVKDFQISQEKFQKCIQKIHNTNSNFQEVKNFICDINDFQIAK